MPFLRLKWAFRWDIRVGLIFPPFVWRDESVLLRDRAILDLIDRGLGKNLKCAENDRYEPYLIPPPAQFLFGVPEQHKTLHPIQKAYRGR